MNNFELDRRAKELAASNSGYNLARRFLMLEDQLAEARREAEQCQQAQGEAIGMLVEMNGNKVGEKPCRAVLNGRSMDLPPGTKLYAAPPAPAAVPERNPIQEVAMERERQDGKWGRESDDQKAPFDWCRIIQDYAGWARTMAGMDSPDKYRKRIIQIAAISVAAVESHDRRMGAAPAPADPK